jgi:NAD(P)-dependent dehydrogenase (short-subunit alcohol dehydrogenase family)
MESINNPLELFSLKGRSFVITGASSGIGQAMAGFLAAAGAHVVLVARRLEPLKDTALDLQQKGCSAELLVADLSDRSLIPDIAATCKKLSPDSIVEGIVNTAGVNLRQPVDEISLESWDATLNLNLSVPFFLSREFVDGMKERQYGRIINIASLQSERAFTNGLAYGASKGGICQLTRAMAEAWSKHGICCNAIAPGFFPTELTAPVFDDSERSQNLANQTTIGRNGELNDLAGLTVFFASAASSYITGQTLFIDGGFTAR